MHSKSVLASENFRWWARWRRVLAYLGDEAVGSDCSEEEASRLEHTDNGITAKMTKRIASRQGPSTVYVASGHQGYLDHLGGSVKAALGIGPAHLGKQGTSPWTSRWNPMRILCCVTCPSSIEYFTYHWPSVLGGCKTWEYYPHH